MPIVSVSVVGTNTEVTVVVGVVLTLWFVVPTTERLPGKTSVILVVKVVVGEEDILVMVVVDVMVVIVLNYPGQTWYHYFFVAK